MALKDIVTLAQSRATGQSDTMSSRARSMTKHLNNLKNNKIKKTVATQHLGGDAVERMKKFLSELEKEARSRARAVARIFGGSPFSGKQRKVVAHWRCLEIPWPISHAKFPSIVGNRRQMMSVLLRF